MRRKACRQLCRLNGPPAWKGWSTQPPDISSGALEQGCASLGRSKREHRIIETGNDGKAARLAYDFPSYRRDEKLADAVIHAVGAILFPAAGVWLVAHAQDMAAAWTLGFYAICMTSMLAASGAYNLAPAGPWKAWLRRVDHACIFAAIAGTYTPLLLLRLPGWTGVVLCLVVWSLAMAGAAFKLLAPQRRERLGLLLYLGLGWIGLPAAPHLAQTLKPETGMLIGLGAMLYTVGAGVHLLERMRFHNACWHLLVLAAAGSHLLAMHREFAVIR